MRRWWAAPVGAVILGWGAASAAPGCGSQPTAGDLWGRPPLSGARSAHATITATRNPGEEALEGDGTVVFKPRTAMSFRLRNRPGSPPAELDVLQVAGATYRRAAATDKWQRSSAPAPDPTGYGATDPRLLGQETVGGDRAWHLRATRGGSAVEMWVRVSDGFPLQVVTGSGTGTVFRFVYDGFNGPGPVVAPPAPEIRPPARVLSGRVGDTLTLSAARIGVISYDDDAVPDEDSVRARPGNRFVVVEVEVENIGARELSTFFDWQLTDSAHDTWSQALAVREPRFPGGELAPGERSRGFLTYEVTGAASQLVLSVKLDEDTVAFALS